MDLNSPGQNLLHGGLVNRPTYLTSRGRSTKFTEKMEGFIDLKRKKKVDRVPDLPVQLVQPDFHQPLKQENPLTGLLLQSSKAFHHEGPTILEQPPSPTYENTLEKYGVKLLSQNDLNTPMQCTTVGVQPEDDFVRGHVKYTKKKGLKNMVADLKSLTSGTHGCILNENFQPDADQYIKGYHFIVDQKLGKGSNGKAALCYDSASRKPYVRKKLLKSSLRTSEVLVPINLNHKNVTKFYGLIQRQKRDGTLKVELMLEYGGTALHHYLRDNTLTDSEIWELTGQGLSGLQQLAYFGMIHLDIKPENICVSKETGQIVLKITDFGSAKLPVEKISFAGWTPEYMAPESCKLVLQFCTQPPLNFGVDQDNVTSKVDVFAFALVVMYLYKRYHILLNVITSGKKSYIGFDDEKKRALQLQLMILLATDDMIANFIPDECDLDMRELLKRMTTHDYTYRLDAQQSLKVVQDREKALKLRQAGYKNEEFTQTVSKLIEKEKVPRFIPAGENIIPEIAVKHMDMETGPIKNNTKDKLRQKLVRGPYKNHGKKGGKGYLPAPNKTVPPQTPVEEMMALSLSHPPNTNTTVQRGERCQIITQPTQEACDFNVTNGSSSSVQMATALAMHDSRMPSQLQYQTAGQVRPFQASNRTSGVSMLICKEEVPTQFDIKCEKMTDDWTLDQSIGLSQEEDFTASLAAAQSPPQQQNLQEDAILELLAGYVRMQNITFGNTDKTVEGHGGFEVGPTATVSGAQESFQQPVEQTVNTPSGGLEEMEVVKHGNIPNFSFL